MVVHRNLHAEESRPAESRVTWGTWKAKGGPMGQAVGRTRPAVGAARAPQMARGRGLPSPHGASLSAGRCGGASGSPSTGLRHSRHSQRGRRSVRASRAWRSHGSTSSPGAAVFSV